MKNPVDALSRASLDSISNKECWFDICPTVVKLFLSNIMGYLEKSTIFTMGLWLSWHHCFGEKLEKEHVHRTSCELENGKQTVKTRRRKKWSRGRSRVSEGLSERNRPTSEHHQGKPCFGHWGYRSLFSNKIKIQRFLWCYT